MKKLSTILFLIMFGFSAISFGQGCQIPPNYFQNSNFEHKLNPLVWTGSWDWGYHHCVAYPEYWITDTTQVHSGKRCMVITYDSWIWPTVTTVGFEQKSMKMSFWYKSPIGKMAFWMFFYRDAKLTPEDIRCPLKKDLVGADTAYITLTAGTSKEEALYFEMGKSTEWKYFEFKFDYPGSIPGSTCTLMFWSEYTPGFIDDVYYGVDFPCVYNGEEELAIMNPDFEAEGLGSEWAVNVFGGNTKDFVTTNENHTPLGAQSLQLWKDFNMTYYMPVLGSEGKDMTYSFWYKGNKNTLKMNFYDDYKVTTADFSLPAGATLTVDSIRKYITDTTKTIDTTIVYDHSKILTTDTIGPVTEIKPSVAIDTMAIQEFEIVSDAPLPIDGQWSGSSYYSDWASTMTKKTSFSPIHSLWLPGDPSWTGVWGGPGGFIDKKAYSWSFMYKGKLSFELMLGRDFKYDLANDPDHIVPAGTTVVSASGKPNAAIHWDLDAKEWTNFSFAWQMGAWLADSSVTSPASLGFNFAGTYSYGDAGYIDHFMIQKSQDTIGAISFIDTTLALSHTYDIDHYIFDTITVVKVVDSTWIINPIAAEWNLPAAADWTQFKINWTNPAGDIGSNLTFIIQSEMGTGADTITYYDDFNYGIATGVKKPSLVNGIMIYPNPVADALYLGTTRQISNASIFNAMGQKVRNIDYPGNRIDVSNLETGLYILNVFDENGKEYRTKFIKK